MLDRHCDGYPKSRSKRPIPSPDARLSHSPVRPLPSARPDAIARTARCRAAGRPRGARLNAVAATRDETRARTLQSPAGPTIPRHSQNHAPPRRSTSPSSPRSPSAPHQPADPPPAKYRPLSRRYTSTGSCKLRRFPRPPRRSVGNAQRTSRARRECRNRSKRHCLALGCPLLLVHPSVVDV